MEQETLFSRLREQSVLGKRAPLRLRSTNSIRWLLVIATCMVCMFLFPENEAPENTMPTGAEWTLETVVAEYDFSINKPQEQYVREVAFARETTPSVFSFDVNADERCRANIESILDLLKSSESDPDIDSISAVIDFPPSAYSDILELRTRERIRVVSQLQRELSLLVSEVYKRGFIDIALSDVNTDEVFVRKGPTQELIYDVAQIFDAETYEEEVVKRAQAVPAITQQLFESLAAAYVKPNFEFDERQTDVLREQRAQSVPPTQGFVREGQVIIRKGDRITEQNRQILTSYHQSQLDLGEESTYVQVLAGNFIHAAVVLSILLVFIRTMRRRIWTNAVKLAGILGAMMLLVAMGKLSMIMLIDVPLELLIAVPTATMLAGILFDSRTAFFVAVTGSLLVAGVRAGDYELGLGALCASSLAGYAVRDVESRQQVFKSTTSIFLGFAFPLIAFALQHNTQLELLGLQLSMALANAAIAPIATFGILWVIERRFNVVTDVRLTEFDDLNHPLIQELKDHAPGTYQHTLTIANLASSAARAINANPLLAKVGSYFHDIGKLQKSEYFVENQINIGNKHDRLSPIKSAKIIRQHVTEGIALGKQYKLPRRILDFIPMHHGTMLIKYFYVKALEEATEGEEVRQEDFRYGGPKPNFREAAIVMIADGVEALSRTVDGNNREAVDEAVHSIIRDRLNDGQLDDCDLSLSDLKTIRQDLVANLIGMSHHRIDYKAIPADEAQSSSSKSESA